MMIETKFTFSSLQEALTFLAAGQAAIGGSVGVAVAGPTPEANKPQNKPKAEAPKAEPKAETPKAEPEAEKPAPAVDYESSGIGALIVKAQKANKDATVEVLKKHEAYVMDGDKKKLSGKGLKPETFGAARAELEAIIAAGEEALS